MDVTLPAAFLGGLLSFLTPCVLPLVPPYLCYLAGLSFEELSDDKPGKGPSGKVLLSALAFVLGFTTIFVALGASASYLGQIITDQFDWLVWVAGGVIIVMGLHFLGLFRLTFLMRDLHFQVKGRSGSVVSAYVIGLAFAFGWTPCAGPLLGTILFLAGMEDSLSQGAWLLLAYSAGMGVPFLLAAFFVPYFLEAMRKFRRHLGVVEKVMGGFLVLSGILIMTGSMNELAFWLQESFPALSRIG
ncbi:cytochrome c biogenesis CcdA family protein [Rhodovibrionaceae bacterium A322]